MSKTVCYCPCQRGYPFGDAVKILACCARGRGFDSREPTLSVTFGKNERWPPEGITGAATKGAALLAYPCPYWEVGMSMPVLGGWEERIILQWAPGGAPKKAS